MANRQEKPKKPGLIEQARRLDAMRVGTETKGLVRSMFELLDLKFRNARGQADPEEMTALEAITRQAEVLATATEAKIDAALEKQSRFKVKSGSVLEAALGHQSRCEDALTRDDNTQLYAVYDGVSSTGHGEIAANLAKNTVERELKKLSPTASLDETKAAVVDALRKAGQAILDYPGNRALPTHRRVSSTAVVVKIHHADGGKRTAVIANVGDSRAYVRKKDGRLIQLSYDHGIVNNLRKSGSIDDAEADRLNKLFAEVVDPDQDLNDADRRLYNQGNVITAQLADDSIDLVVSTYELEDGDQLLLTSDGISDLVPHGHMEDAFNTLSDPEDITQQLLADANRPIRRGGGTKVDDDKAAIVVQWEDTLESEERDHIKKYIREVDAGGPLTMPLTTVDQTAFSTLVRHGYAGLQEAFAGSYDAMYEEEWRAAGAGDWIDAIEKVAAQPEPVTFGRQTLSHDQVIAVERKLLYEAQCLGDAAKLATVKFTEARGVLAEKDIVDRLNRLINLLLEKGVDLTGADITAEPRCQELADQLGLAVEDVVTTITTYQQVVIERAAQQESLERKLSKQLLKAGLYLAGGTALTASAIVAPPVALGIIAGTRLVDRLFSHRDQVKKQAEYLKHSLEQIKTQHAARQLALDELAVSLAARKREQLTVRTSPSDIAGQMLTSFRDKYCLTEYANAQEALNNYNDGTGSYDNYETLNALYLQKLEPYRRAADGYQALLEIDQQMMELSEEQQKQATTWVEKNPKIAALLGYRNELISEKVGSAAFFTVAGLAAREWLPVRVALSAFAGARAGEALMMWKLKREEETIGEFTRAELDAIDVTQPDRAAAQLDTLEATVAEARYKLADAKFRRQQPKQYEALYQLVTRFEQLRAAVNAQRALNTMVVELSELEHVSTLVKQQKTLNTWRRRIFSVTTGVLAGGASALLGSNLDEWLERFKMEQPPTTGDAGGWLESIKSSVTGWFEREDSGTEVDDTADAATPAEPATPDAAPEPTPEPTPAEPPAATPVPEQVQPSAAAEPPQTAEPVVEAPSSEAPATAKVIGEGQGLSHGLAGQGSRAEINQLLHDTKVSINGHDVALANTGVAEGGKLEVGVATIDGHKVIELYDATTHEKIAPEDIDKYLYEMGHTPTAAPEAPEVVTIPAESPDGEGVAVEPTDGADQPGFELRTPLIGRETFVQYEEDVMRDYVRSHPDYAALETLSDEDLVSRPELHAVHEAITQQYRAATQAEAVPVPPPPGQPEPAAPATTVAEGLVEKGKLTATGMKELTLAEHVSVNGEPEQYSTFKKEILDLLAADKRQRITTANGLVFEDRAGQLYVDVAGGSRDAYLLDENLYNNLMTGYKTLVEPDLHGRFTREAFYTALDIADVPHDPHSFELEQINLNHFISKGEPVPYTDFQRNLTEFMKDHDLARFLSPNGLVFYRENNQLFVDVEGGLARQYPLNGQLYEALMARYQDLGYDYHEKFDVTQFEYVLKQVEGKK